MTLFLEEKKVEHEPKVTEHQLLDIIYKCCRMGNGVSREKIAKCAEVEPEKIDRLLDKMERKRYVWRNGIYLTITEKGIRAHDKQAGIQ
jgi:DNA-binding MarR family transcriptional regulator